MLNNGNKINCGFADEIVSYIYDEIGVAERTIFETHLADCPVCTDEFAAISNARLSVFEWQREEFSHLLTPEIIIPHAAKRSVVGDDAQVGFFAGLRGLFGDAVWPALVAASLLLCLGLGFVAINYVAGDQQIVANGTVPPVAVHNQNINIPDSTINIDVSSSPIAKDNPAAVRNINDTAVHPAKAVGTHRPSRQLSAEAQRTVSHFAQRKLYDRKAPVLSSYDDNDDKSLRLSDLFEDEVRARR